MDKTLLTIEFDFLIIKAISKKGSVLVKDVKNNLEYWVLRRVFMRLINLKQLDGVIATTPPNELGKEMRTLIVLSPF